MLSFTPAWPWHRSGFASIGLAVLCLGVADTMAAPPPNADGTYRAWFQNLRQPTTGMSCCSISDCRMTEYRAGQEGYEVLLAGRWIPVPQDKILRGIENPTGRAVVCAHPDGEILCFVTPEET
jgi:hypothetical protein